VSRFGYGFRSSTHPTVTNIEVTNDSTYSSYAVQVPEHLWKVLLVLDRPGLGIGEITSQNAKAFAVWTENTLPDPGSSPYTPWYNGGMQIMSVSALEALLNRDSNNRARGIEYNFFSNLSEGVRQQIKSTIPYVPTNNPKTAFLLASEDDASDTSSFISTNAAIWHDGFVENSTFKISTRANLSTTQVSSGQVGKSQSSAFEIGSSQIAFRQVSSTQLGETNTSSAQISPLEISPAKYCQTENGTSQIRMTEISALQEELIKISTSEVRITQIGSTQLVTSVDRQLDKISLPSSITLQQLLSSHNYNLQNTAVPTWLEFLQGTSPFNLNIEITDLPTGQLAEANITGFDLTGYPNAGTLYLDTDANGLGWFIDPTPWDNTEYSQTLTDTAYRATVDSLAYGHYDLLTTLLHETAHIQGFIAGYSNYDRHIQTINGSKTFVGDGFSAILTPDGSHLSSSVYTYDLMNTTLTPGVRKLPSALDIQILNTINNAQFATHRADLAPTAALSAGALIAINNGSFDTNNDWTTRGDTHILNGQAILSEDSPYLSHLSQTFVIPQGAKALQFTLVNTDLHNSNNRFALSDSPSEG
jgi:hypothetical protein